MSSKKAGGYSEDTVSAKPRKPRPSRGRGLRTTSGCLTCRKRRLKCDESKPACSQCLKSSRDCLYDTASTGSTSESPLNITSPISPIERSRVSLSLQHGASMSDGVHSQEETAVHRPLNVVEKVQSHEQPSINLAGPFTTTSPTHSFASPLTSSSFTPGGAPQDWFELLANDAVKDIDNYNFLTANASRWSFETRAFRPLGQAVARAASSVHHSPKSSQPLPSVTAFTSQPVLATAISGASYEETPVLPWNTAEPHVLRQYELSYLQYYIDDVAPILDLYDPQHHFSVHLIHLALRNVGILKSVLAVAALHRARTGIESVGSRGEAWNPPATAKDQPMPDSNMATQYYYETLSYLSQAMQYSGYHHSKEILANAILISWYEAFDTEASPNWERHLKGVFWIQRSQDNDGESGGLRQAVWWNWLRQDVWSAFRHSRKTLTIWRPKKLVTDLSHDELACRAVYLQAKAVGYASEEMRKSLDFRQRIEEGEMLLNALQEWFDCLPRAFHPLPAPADSLSNVRFTPVWIHPPAFAAAMQAYYAAKILVLVNRPSFGGRNAWLDVQQPLDEAFNMICGIAQAPNASVVPLAIVNTQALFISGQCVHTREQQEILLRLLEEAVTVSRIPSSSLIRELQHMWSQR